MERCLRKIGEGLEDMKLDTFFRREGTTMTIGSEVVDGPTITDLTFGAVDAAICTAMGTRSTRVGLIISSTHIPNFNFNILSSLDNNPCNKLTSLNRSRLNYILCSNHI
jgi:hypothetical protein